MRRPNKLSYCLLLGPVAAFCATPVYAQAITTGQNPLDNAAAAGARAPGDMVISGVAQAVDFGNAGQSGVQITETAPPTSVRAQALADSFELLFQQLNQAILLFHNLLALRGGQTPSASGLPSIPGLGDADLSDLTGQTGGRRKLAPQIESPTRTPKPRPPATTKYR